MLKLIAIAFAGCGLAAAQFGQITSPLRQYLELTQDQVRSIDTLNQSLSRFQIEKARRTAQVYAEISEETARPTMDPMALGLRYLELEGIRREVQAEKEKTVTEVQKVLTAAQKTKLQALIEVLRMYPTACEAAATNFIPQPDQQVLIPTSRLINPVPVPGGIVGGIIGGIGCTGSFSSIILDPGTSRP